jgi:hypothetical protein
MAKWKKHGAPNDYQRYYKSGIPHIIAVPLCTMILQPLMKTFLHMCLSTPRSLPLLPLNHEILEPIRNLPLHLNNIEKTSKRLHNECTDMMMVGINYNCPPLQELAMEVGVVHDIMLLICMT